MLLQTAPQNSVKHTLLLSHPLLSFMLYYCSHILCITTAATFCGIGASGREGCCSEDGAGGSRLSYTEANSATRKMPATKLLLPAHNANLFRGGGRTSSSVVRALGLLGRPPLPPCGVLWFGLVTRNSFLGSTVTEGHGWGGGGWGVRSTLADSVTVNARELYSSCSFWSRGLLNIISSWSMWSRLSLKPAVSVLSQSIHVPTRITSRSDSTRSRRASMCQP